MQPDGYCHCGCGESTPLARRTDSRSGIVAGQPTRFLRGHHNKVGLPPEYRVDAKTGCWVWQRYVLPSGYGRIGAGGRQREAHRVYYERHVGPVPEGLQLDHTCHTNDSTCLGGAYCLHRRCVNPAHLEPVTVAENARRGVRAKLTAAQAAEILGSAEDGPTLARRFGVNKSAIYKIRKGQRWVPERMGRAA